MVTPGRTLSSCPTKSSNHQDIVSVMVYFSRESEVRYASLYVYANLFSWLVYTTHFQATSWSFQLLPAGQATLKCPQLSNLTHTVLTEWQPRPGISESNLKYSWKNKPSGIFMCWVLARQWLHFNLTLPESYIIYNLHYSCRFPTMYN